MRKKNTFSKILAALLIFSISAGSWAYVTIRADRTDVPYGLNRSVDPFDSRAIVPYLRDGGATTYETLRGARAYDDVMCRSTFANRCINQVCITSSLRHCTDICRSLARDKCRVNRSGRF